METLDITLTVVSPVKEYDLKLEERAEKHECLRGKNNVTSCRSPNRGIDVMWIKTEMQRKRQLEFERRRPVSPNPTCLASERQRDLKSKGRALASICQATKSEPQQVKFCKTATSNSCQLMTPSKRMTNEDASTNKWALLWSDSGELGRHEKHPSWKPETNPSILTPIRQNTKQRVKASKKIERATLDTSHLVHNSVSRNVTITGLKTGIRESNRKKTLLLESSVQTESGVVTVKESEILQLAEYLQEALWREEALKKKLSVLQKTATTLICSSNKLWTTRCNEDLLRSKIKALEAQLQVCLQKFSRDGVKKLVVQMEKQRGVYEEKALAAIQRATQEKTEALSKNETLQEELRAAKAEASHWQGLYEDLKQSSANLKKSQDLSIGQLHQLQAQLEMARCQEAGLLEEVESLQQEGAELLSSMAQLEEDNEALREEVQSVRDDRAEIQNAMAQMSMSSQRPEEEHLKWREEAQVMDQLHRAQDRLRVKDKECEELQTELEAMGQEYQSYQARLAQCRDEIRQLSHHRSSRKKPCGSWRGVCVVLVLLLVAAGVAMLWLWHPPFRDQVEHLYADLEKCMEDYLLEVSSPQHSGRFRPV